MGNRGRFGKYGEHKRIERLRVRGEVRHMPLNKGYVSKRPMSKVVVFERARAEHKGFIRDLGHLLFSQYGDYKEFLPAFVDQESCFSWVTRVGAELVGFAIVSPYEGLGVPAYELTAIGIHPLHQGRGLGRGLLGFVLKELRRKKISCLVLHTATQNTIARGLFSSMGFLPLGRKAFFYRDQDAIMMIKSLGSNRGAMEGLPGSHTQLVDSEKGDTHEEDYR